MSHPQEEIYTGGSENGETYNGTPLCEEETVSPQPVQKINIVSPDTKYYNIKTDASSYV